MHREITSRCEAGSHDIKVELRVAADTLQSLHEMIAADVFIGSNSGLSTHVVGSISRGAMQLLPYVDPRKDMAWSTHLRFDGDVGTVWNETRLIELWASYERRHRWSAWRALLQAKLGIP